MRFRHLYMSVGSILVLTIWLLTDPDTGVVQNLPIGSGTIATIIILLKSVLYVGMLHISRRALIDYIDLEVYFKRALQSSEGSGYACIAVSIMMVAIALVITSATA